MQLPTSSEVRHRDLEAWTRDDAEAWRDAERHPVFSEAWTDDDVLLDNDLWTDDDLAGELSAPGLRRLGIRTL